MEKTLFIISRALFVSVIGISCIAFVFWQAVEYSNSSPKKVFFSYGKEENSGVVVGEAKSEDKESIVVSEEVKQADARPEIIRAYLTKYKSPLLPYSDLIFELSEKYGYDYYWIVAIAQQESNLCKKIPEDSHNCWGYGIHKRGTLKFENYELALNSYAEYLSREYFKKGLTTPELIMKKYCPSSNGSWARGVQQFIDEMERGKF